MVRGLALAEELGYCRDARVQVTDPTAGRQPWIFTVPNDEHATLSCQTPPPPEWIKPGVMIRIEVETPLEAADELLPVAGQPIPVAPETELDVDLAACTSSSGLKTHVVYAIDVGSPNSGLAWARLRPKDESICHGSMDFDHFLNSIVNDLRASLPVSLGFEAPLFLPVVQDFQ
ncbi:hypothetical protein RMSM_01379, partial [Rhodopirellula maiorica SM1]